MLEADGLQPGDRVAVLSHNSLAYCALNMGIIRTGGIVSPIDCRYTPHEIREMCETTEPRSTIAAPEFAVNAAVDRGDRGTARGRGRNAAP